jgi:phospholipid/cholesterol/gamma-HCH transport system substrate-binding protein
MNEQNMRFRIGVFALTSFILLAILVILFGGVPTVFLPEDRYTVIFDQATGVAPGTPVRRSGVRIGQVQKVELDDATGKVRVTINIDRPHVLYQDDQPVLVHGALSGDTSIDLVVKPETPKQETENKKPDPVFVPVSYPLAQAQPDAAQPPPQRPPGRPIARPGTEFRGVSQTDVPDLLDKLSHLTPSAQEALLELRKTMERVEKMTPLFEETLKVYRDLGKSIDVGRTNEEIQSTARTWNRLGERVDVLLQTNQDKLVETLSRVSNVVNEENQRNLATTLKNISTSSRNFESISKGADDLLKESQKSVIRLNDTITRADELFGNLQQATKPLAERGPAMIKNLDEGADRFNKSLADLQDLLRVMNQSDGAFRRLIADPALYDNINSIVCAIARDMPRIQQILKDIEVFSDKIARHPESLGVRGAVAPGKGLKENPTRPMYTPRGQE